MKSCDLCRVKVPRQLIINNVYTVCQLKSICQNYQMIKTLADESEEIPKKMGEHTKTFLDSLGKISVGDNSHDFQYLCSGCENLQLLMKKQVVQ